MKIRIMCMLLLLATGCSQQRPEDAAGQSTETPEFSEAELVNDEPAADGSNVLTSYDLVLREVAEIDNDKLMRKSDYVYLMDESVIPFEISYNEDERGIRWYRKGYYEIETENYNFAVSLYFDREAHLIFGRYIRSSINDNGVLSLNISYSTEGDVLYFYKETLTDAGTDFSLEFTESVFSEDFEGILHFFDAYAMVSAPRMVEKAFYIGAREDFFDVGDGEIENADKPVAVASKQDDLWYGYKNVSVIVRENEQGQKVSYRSNKSESEPLTEVPLPANSYFKGRWGEALIFETKTDSGLKLYVFGLKAKDFVLVRDIANMAITKDKKFLVFTARVTENDVEYTPLCTPEYDGQEIGYLEVIHLDSDYNELRYGQVYCYLRYR